MYGWFLVSMWIHLLAAITWIGGLSFIAMVLVPTVRRPEVRAQALVLLRVSGTKFMRIAYASLVTLVVTGSTNLLLKAGGSLQGAEALFSGTYGRLLETKITLVVIVIALALYHDFVVGPAATRAMESDPEGATALALRRRASWIGRINMLLSVVIMTLALLLVRGLP